MTRAHFQRPVLDAAGNVRLNAVVRILEANSQEPIAQPLYQSDGGQEQLANPHTFSNGVIDFYLNTAQRVRIGVRFGSGAEFFYEDVDVFHIDHVHSAIKVYYEPNGNIITANNVQQALATLENLLEEEGYLTTATAEDEYLKKVDAVDSTVGATLPATTDRLEGDLHTIPDADPTKPGKVHTLVDVAGTLTWVETGGDSLVIEDDGTPMEPRTTLDLRGSAVWLEDDTDGEKTVLFLRGTGSSAAASPPAVPVGAEAQADFFYQRGDTWGLAADGEVEGDFYAMMGQPGNGTLRWVKVGVGKALTEAESDAKYVLKEEEPLDEEDPETGEATTFVPSFSLQTIVQGDLVAGATNISAPGLRVVKASTAKVLVVHIGTPPTGSPAVIEFTRTNGGTGTQSLGSVTIAAGETAGFLTINVPCAKGDMIRHNVISVGSTVAGADVNLAVDFL